MEKKNRTNSILIAASILFAGLCVTGYATNRNNIDSLRDELSETLKSHDTVTTAEATVPEEPDYASTLKIYSPKVPEFIVFAGDTIRFDSSDMYERMDRELIAFTYSHQISLLMIKRAPKYFPIVEPLLKECGVPDDLKYLMVIESNLDPEARSSAGAAGFWQFMQGTAKEYGLEIGPTIDERYNVEKATRAACMYLKDAYGKYHDWMTVAASYNAGQNGISNRISHQRQKRAFNLWLPAETSRYMFRILTAKMMLEDPAAFGFNLTEEDLYKFEKPRKTLTVTGEIEDLAEYAADHGVTFAQLHRANPWLRDIKFKPSSPTRKYQIIIPEK